MVAGGSFGAIENDHRNTVDGERTPEAVPESSTVFRPGNRLLRSGSDSIAYTRTR